MTGSYAEWEEPRRLVDRGERKLSDSAASCPASSRPRSGSAPSTGSAQFRIGSASLSLSAFASGEWFELAQKMFDVTSDNVFVIGSVGEAPNILLTNNDLRKRALGVEDTTTCGNVSTEFAVSNTDWRGNLVAAMSRTTLP